MTIVNDKLLADNLKRINGLRKVGLSDDTIASATRDRTGDPSITVEDITSFRKVANIAAKKMLISANQGKNLTQFAQGANDQATSAVTKAKKTSKNSETSDSEA